MAMPGPMPYHFEKGQWLAVLEDYLNTDRSVAWDALERLRDDGRRLDDYLGSGELDATRFETQAARWGHIAGDWYGWAPAEGTEGPLLPQPSFAEWMCAEPSVGLSEPLADDPDAIYGFLDDALADGALDAVERWPTTGHWHNYYGDVYSIVRLTLARAIEVALGVRHGETDRGAATRHLPIEIFWKCPQKWFEGWITWRLLDDRHDRGIVSIVLASPGAGEPVLERPTAGRFAEEDPDIAPPRDIDLSEGGGDGGAGCDGDARRGMWVVTHSENLQLPALASSRERPHGEWLTPAGGPVYAGVGPLVTVEPYPAGSGRRGGRRVATSSGTE